MDTLDKITSPAAPPIDRPTMRELLEAGVTKHAVWSVPLLRSLSAGWLSAGDARFVLPILTAVEVARCDGLAVLARRASGDTHDRLTAAIPARTPSALLVAWAGEPATDAPTLTFVRYFVQQCATVCRDSDLDRAAAFLLGGELVIARIYAAMTKALAVMPGRTAPAGDDHGDVLAGLLGDITGARARATHAAVRRSHHAAVEHMLTLYQQLFEDTYQAVRFQRQAAAFDRIQARTSLARDDDPPIPLAPGVGVIDLETRDDARRIEFTVERYPGAYQILDPRVVRIAPGKTNNLHKHAHETLFLLVSGTGRILIGTTWVPLGPGEAVFAPRWVMHQTENTGDCELVMLAITDYHHTVQVYVGSYDKV